MWSIIWEIRKYLTFLKARRRRHAGAEKKKEERREEEKREEEREKRRKENKEKEEKRRREEETRFEYRLNSWLQLENKRKDEAHRSLPFGKYKSVLRLCPLPSALCVDARLSLNL